MQNSVKLFSDFNSNQEIGTFKIEFKNDKVVIYNPCLFGSLEGNEKTRPLKVERLSTCGNESQFTCKVKGKTVFFWTSK